MCGAAGRGAGCVVRCLKGDEFSISNDTGAGCWRLLVDAGARIAKSTVSMLW